MTNNAEFIKSWKNWMEAFVIDDIKKALDKDALEVGLIILTLLGIECLSAYYTGKRDSDSGTFEKFMRKYFPPAYTQYADKIYRSLRNGLISKIGAVLIVIGGIDMIAVGFFPMDPAGLPNSLTNIGHDITATIASNAVTIGMIVLTLGFRKDNQWRPFWLFTLVSAIASIALSPFPMFPTYNPYAGLIQRMAMGFALLWIDVISIKLLSLVRRSDTRPHEPKSTAWQ